ncbi:hypothetical protein [Acinetobacter sp. HY1485]|uniref:hypothetical protein n=1 Tax=Acinetobacter sp. HY1485 TaxID=2970918 RepID=UPI0022B9636A|nr:hypothetical protein [Acinetobacter sp. HY1485]
MKYILLVVLLISPALVTAKNNNIDDLIRDVGYESNQRTAKTIEKIITPAGSHWKIACKRDRFDDTKICKMISKELQVSLIQGQLGVLVGRRHASNSKSAIKIDNNKTLYGAEGVFSDATQIIYQMKKGRTVYTRFYELNKENNKDDEISLDGFTERFEKMKSIYDQL